MRHRNRVMYTVTTLTTLALLVSPSVTFAATSGKHKKATPSVTKNVGTLVALGDSITFGYNLGNNQAPSKEAFPYLIGKKDHLNVNDLGVPGWTSTDLLQALSSSTSMQDAVKSANVVTVDIGSNDLLQPATPILEEAAMGTSPTAAQLQTLGGELVTAVSTMSTNVGQILGNIEKMNPKATIVLYDLYNPIPTTSTALYNLGETAITAANLELAKLAISNQIVIADAYDAFHGHNNYILKNDVHPNAIGQRVLAKQGEIALEVSPLFKSLDTPQGWQSISWWLGQQIVNWNKQ